MPYAAAIRGPKDALEDVAPSFASPIAQIRLRDDEWILKSSTFEPYQSDEQLYASANDLLSLIHQLLALYLGRYHEPLSVHALLLLTDDDKLIARRRYKTYNVDIVKRAKQVFSPTASESLATVVLSRATTDPAVRTALSLVGAERTNWPQVYDIIEFLGIDQIVKLGFARRAYTELVAQTANHYRHLGRSRKSKLPQNKTAPTLGEASLFATDLLKRWIATRIARPG